MPPKRKLHELACVVADKTIITDTRKQRFIVEKEFARGGFGRIYSGKQEGSKEYGKNGALAIKIEPYANGPLFTEITVFQRILMPEKLNSWMSKREIVHLGLPPYVSSGLFTYNGERLRFLIMPRYEKSLETYRIANGGCLDMPVVLTVAKQCADCLWYMQDHDYVHGDLKADNILLASSNAFFKCFLVDFGLAKMAKGNVDKPDKKRAHNGTLLFTSIDAHRGCAPSFRGDLEILGYNILYWLCGTLPWQKCAEKPDAVMAEKEKFAKELDQSLKKLVRDGCVFPLSKLFKLAYETPYVNKVDYEAVHAILNQINIPAVSPKNRNPKSTGDKENARSLRMRSKADYGDSSPSSSRKRKAEITDFAVVLTDEQVVHGNRRNSAVAGRSTRGSKNRQISNKTLSSSPVKLGSMTRRRSNRIAAQKSQETDESSRVTTSDEKSSKSSSIVHSDDDSSKSPKKYIRKLRPRPRAGLRSIAKRSAFLPTAPSFSKSKKADDSPGKKLRSVIPGVRDMKNVRRSLKDALVKKYIDVANRVQK